MADCRTPLALSNQPELALVPAWVWGGILACQRFSGASPDSLEASRPQTYSTGLRWHYQTSPKLALVPAWVWEASCVARFSGASRQLRGQRPQTYTPGPFPGKQKSPVGTGASLGLGGILVCEVFREPVGHSGLGLGRHPA
uniref:Uncharacterized protein n=1 Tax=Geospiza parvula TaxID=87175 RepID=A0A8U8AZ57_GEOPR